MADVATVASVGLSGAQCMAQWVREDCGPPSWSFSYAACAGKFLLIPSAVCLARTKSGQKQLAKLAGPELTKAVDDFAGGTVEELLKSLPPEVKSVAQCIVDKAGLEAAAAAGEALSGKVESAAKRLAPYAAGCGLLEVADKLGTGVMSDILKKIAGQLTAPPPPTKTKTAGAFKEVCYEHWTKGGKKMLCPGEPGYVSIYDIPVSVWQMAAKAPQNAQQILEVNQQIMQASLQGGAGKAQPQLLPLVLVAGLIWAVS